MADVAPSFSLPLSLSHCVNGGTAKPTQAGKKEARPSNPVVTAYLVLYNAALAGGWAYVLYLAAAELVATGGKWEGVWDKVEQPLKVAQTAAVLEVIHAVLGTARTRARAGARVLILTVGYRDCADAGADDGDPGRLARRHSVGRGRHVPGGAQAAFPLRACAARRLH